MAKSRSKHQGTKYSAYKAAQVWSKNRRAKLEKHLKAHPTDEKAVAATKNISYRRKTPKGKVWSSTMRATAIIFKLAEGRVNPNIFNANDTIRNAAKMSHKGKVKALTGIKQMFSLATRAHDKNGVSIW